MPNQPAAAAPADRQAGSLSAPGERANPKRETWQDWMPSEWFEFVPSPPLVTREELLTSLHAEGFAVGTSTLRVWEQTGILPHPTRARRLGAAGVYPAWHVEVVKEAARESKRQRGRRVTPAERRKHLRAVFHQQALQTIPTEAATQIAGRWPAEPPDPEPPELPAEIARALRSWVARLNGQGDHQIARVSIRLEDGRRREVAAWDMLLPRCQE